MASAPDLDSCAKVVIHPSEAVRKSPIETPSKMADAAVVTPKQRLGNPDPDKFESEQDVQLTGPRSAVVVLSETEKWELKGESNKKTVAEVSGSAAMTAKKKLLQSPEDTSST
ncbi:hypothetical protein Tco_1435698, partial [Tanacetum coccineum]